MWRVVNKDKLEQLKETYGFLETMYMNPFRSNVFEYTPEIVYAEEGVYPQQIPVLLAITGDPGDGIPGCKGVSSAAAPLVDEYNPWMRSMQPSMTVRELQKRRKS